MSRNNRPTRAIFHGSASPFSASIFSLNDAPFYDLVPGPPAAALGVDGGLNRSESQGGGYRGIFKWGPTVAECRGEVFPDGHAEGRIISSIRGFSAFNDPETFTADEVTLELVGNLAPGAGPVLTIFDMRRVVFAGLVIDKKPLVITRGDLDDTVFKRPLGAKVAVTSFVKSFRHDGQVKQGNSLWVKGFGTLFFGEVWGDQYIRSVSMVRMELGCTVGGNGNLGGGQPQPSTGL